MVFKRGLVIAAAILGTAGIATAEEAKVEATKAAPMVNLLPNFYSSFQLRHYTNVAVDKSETKGTNVSAQGRLYVGSTFLDGDVDVMAVLRMKKDTQTNQFRKISTEVLTQYSIYSNDLYSAYSYADLYFPTDGGATEGNLALGNSVSKKVSTAAGSLSWGAGFELVGAVSTSQSETEVTNLDAEKAEAFGLKGDDTNMIGTEATPFYGEVSLNVGLADVAQVKGLSVKFINYMSQSYDPKMEQTVVSGEDRVAMTGYTKSKSSTNLYLASYKLTETVKLTNEFYHNFGGIYESRKNSTDATSNKRYTNIFKVSKTL